MLPFASLKLNSVVGVVRVEEEGAGEYVGTDWALVVGVVETMGMLEVEGDRWRDLLMEGGGGV